MKRYWLVKSEPDVYSFAHLKKDGKTGWTGVRNYAARNHMRDLMKLGDEVLYYHSNAKPQVIVGIATVSREAHPDPTQFDSKSEYYDPKSKPDAPTWMMVELSYGRDFKHAVALDDIKKAKGLEKMVLLNNSRLSVQPVTEREFEIIAKLAGA